MLIAYQLKTGRGWHPITCMVKLATELLQADLMVLREGAQIGWLRQLHALLPSHRGTESCLLICPGVPELRSFLLIEGWRRRFRRLMAWVIDSAFTEFMPRIVRNGRPFDHLFVTTQENVAEWTHLTGTPTSWLPWGSDVLSLGSATSERPIDVLRVGREPAEWDDDSVTERACVLTAVAGAMLSVT